MSSFNYPATDAQNAVTGPPSSTDNALARFSGTSGTAIKNSSVIVSDAGAMTGVASIVSSGNINGASPAEMARLSGLSSNAQTQLTANATAISTETTNRVADVDAEETRALAAELVLQGNIDDEETRALAAEGVVQGNLDDHEADVANPHSVTAAQVGLGNVDNTSDATKNAAVAALTNKSIASSTIVADTTTIVDATDATKTLKVDLTLNSSGVDNVLQFDNTSDITIFFPVATTRLVGHNTTDTLTNKTLTTPIINDYMDINEESAPATPASGLGRLYVNTSGQLKFINDAGVTKTLDDATNGESGLINYYKTTDIALTANFTGGDIRVTRIGNVVTISSTSSLTWASAASVTAAAIIPAEYRPSGTSRQNIFDLDGTGVFTATVTTGGNFSIACRDWTGASVARTGTGNLTITYTI